MDGVFINLTEKDVKIKNHEREFIIPPNPELVTPVTEVIKKEALLSGIVSTPLADEDIHTIQSTQMLNTVYTKIERSEKNAQMVSIVFENPYMKHPFSDHQIELINKISQKRTRLFILNKEDAVVWSSGNFECPFRNYRLFIVGPEGSLIEYPIPKTYLDLALAGFRRITGT